PGRRGHQHPHRKRKTPDRGEPGRRRKGRPDGQCQTAEGGHDREDGEMNLTAWLQDQPIRQKLRWIVLIIAGVSVLGACAVFVSYQWASSRNAMARQLE